MLTAEVERRRALQLEITRFTLRGARRFRRRSVERRVADRGVEKFIFIHYARQHRLWIFLPTQANRAL